MAVHYSMRKKVSEITFSSSSDPEHFVKRNMSPNTHVTFYYYQTSGMWMLKLLT